jgi:hypothetical protein
MWRLQLLAVLAVLVAGCGAASQDADEPSGTFDVDVAGASFPAHQHIAQPVELRLRVHNGSSRTLANIAVTVETAPRGGAAPVAFGQGQVGSTLADSARPVWVLDRGPKGGDTTYDNTWTAGPLRAGRSRELTWRLVAAKAGTYTVSYRVFPGLTGRAKAGAGRTGGSFHVTIDGQPVPAHVGDHGQVIRGS